MSRQPTTQIKLTRDDVETLLSALLGEGVNPPEENARLINRLNRARLRV